MIKNIIFDFDGVILDSVPTKTEAYKKLFEGFDAKKIEELLKYHKKNGGISRYVKVKYFFEELLKQSITDDEILEYTNQYSKFTKVALSSPKYLIDDTISFIKQNYKEYNMHIASGADENDLKYICNKLDLTQYFQSLNGSPIKKTQLVASILLDNNYRKEETILIGDSINDYESSNNNGIEFYGYNNIELKNKNKYIKNCRMFNL